MRETYRTVTARARVELEERKSRFIAICQPLASEREALAFIGGVRQSYPDASHHVYAWILGGDLRLQRFSDDGEPQGTAGLPVLDVLVRHGIDQAGIVVTRYFGGILLGTGGLVRAYGRAAALALAEARPVQMQLCRICTLQISYADHDRLRRQLERAGFQIGNCRFEQAVDLEIAAPVARVDELRQTCADATGGMMRLEPAELVYRPLPPPDPPPA
jgi:uncharacterized YigZ family protein